MERERISSGMYLSIIHYIYSVYLEANLEDLDYDTNNGLGCALINALGCDA